MARYAKGETMTEDRAFRVTVKVAGKPDYTAVVEAADEWKARTRIMFEYPHQLRGAFVAYDVERER